MSELKELEAFIAVANTGSFVAAGQKLGLSKAMLSRRVADLEARLQVRLMNRTTRKTSLTESGRAYFERCSDILNQLQEANAAVMAHTGQVRGKLRINAPLSFGNLHLAPLWGAFMMQHPHVELDIMLSDRFVDTVEEGFDLTVRIGQLTTSSLIAKQLSSSRLVACASPQYLAKNPPIKVPQDIVGHRVNVYTGSTAGSSWAFTSAQGKVETISVLASQGVRCNSGDTCMAAAIAGYGLSYSPAFLVEPHIKTGALQAVLPDYTTPVVGVYAMYPSRKHLSGKVRAMVDFLAHAFADKRWD